MKVNEIKLDSVTVSYGLFKKIEVLRDLSLTMKAGEVTILYGPNGIGKTSLIRALCGQLQLSGGSIEWHGKDLTNALKERRFKSTGNFEAGKMLYQYATLKENLILNNALLEGIGLTPIEQAENLLGKEKLLNNPIDEMSLGQRQRSSLICALRKPAELYFFDEPDNGLDREALDEFIDTLLSEPYNRAVNVIATHDSFLVSKIGHQVAFMAKDKFIVKKRDELPTDITELDKMLYNWIKHGVYDE